MSWNTCPACGVVVNMDNCYWGHQANGGQHAFCSSKCYEQYAKQFRIESLDGTSIYRVPLDISEREYGYVPYLGCSYYFKTPEECMARVKSGGAVFDPDSFAFFWDMQSQ